jgi:hypothetical protein
MYKASRRRGWQDPLGAQGARAPREVPTPLVSHAKLLYACVCNATPPARPELLSGSPESILNPIRVPKMSDLDLPTPSSPITSATRAALSAVEISDSPLAPVKRGRGRPAADPNAPKPPPREKQPTKTKKVQKEEKIGIDVGCFVVAMLRCHLGPFPPSARLGTKNEADEIRFPANRI